MHDDLRHHAVVVRRDKLARPYRGNNFNTFFFREMAGLYLARMRPERQAAVTLLEYALSINTRFHSVTITLYRQIGNRFARGNAELLRYDIDPADPFRNRMFDLQPGIHFHEIDRVGRQVVDKLNGARANITDLIGYVGSGSDHLLQQFLGQRCRS